AGFNGYQYGMNSGNGLSGYVWNRVSSTKQKRVMGSITTYAPNVNQTREVLAEMRGLFIWHGLR
ncbi:MAG: hypothetical protein OSB68_09760, partial [Dehalococcoidia bacterium]|nr:hypothetical protein [Dehalococcoidia bacterium]